MKKIFIGVAWPYANGPIHLGHVAGCYLGADIFRRYQKMNGKEVLMVSGSDQHGTPTAVTAEREGVRPEDIAEKYHEINSQSLRDLGIEFDLFTKTSTENHRKVVQNFFLKLKENGYIYEKETMQLYCSECERFLPDRYVEGTCPHCGYEKARGDQCDNCGKILDPLELKRPRCQICGSTPEPRSSLHFFFKLSALQDRLMEYVESKKEWRSSVRSFTYNWLKSGLKDRGITRDIKWGVEVPVDGWEDKRLYVWFEAVIGYLSASVEFFEKVGKPELWKEYWEENSESKHYYFLGKDNISFHTIIWPGMLIAHGGLKLPDNVVANQYLMYGGEQFSKSRGISIEVQDVLKNFSQDQVRYYLTANMPENRDSDFTWDDFERRVNTELIDTLGNYAHRVLTFTVRNFGSIPEAAPLSDSDRDILKKAEETFEFVTEHMERVELKQAIGEIIALARAGNQYMATTAPWDLIKSDRDRCATVMNVNLRIVKAISVMLNPFLPSAAGKLWGYLKEEGEIGWDCALEPLSPGKQLDPAKPLFSKVQIDKAVFPAFEKLNLRVGRVVSVENHPDADRLYVLKVNIGEKEPRQLVAGLKSFYSPEELLGKDLVIVSNLEPAKLRGVRSEGMLMAADYKGADGEIVAFLTPAAEAPPGTPVSSGLAQSSAKIPYKQFSALRLVIGEVVDAEHVEIGGKQTEVLPHRAERGQKVAVYLDTTGKGLVLATEAGAPVVPEKDIPTGAEIR